MRAIARRCCRVVFGLLVMGLAQAPAAVADEPGTAEPLRAALEAHAAAQDETEPRARAARFERAALGFLAVSESRPGNANLLANAGTAAMQARRPDLAVLAFRRALAIDPAHARAGTNLAVVRDSMPAWVPTPEPADALTLLDPATHLGPERAGVVLVIVTVLAGALVGVAAFRRTGGARAGAGVAVTAWLLLLVPAYLGGDGDDAAAVVMTELQARAADSANAPLRYREPLPPGTEVVIAEERDGWTRIRLADGRDAWVRPGGLRRVVPNT